MQPEKSKTFTYQTRLHLEPDEAITLDGIAELMGRVERTLFADIQRGKQANKLKSSYLEKFKITARQFNSIRIVLEGKMNSIKQLRPQQISELENRITSLHEKIQKLEKKKSKSQEVHQKKRRLSTLTSRCNQLKQDEDTQVTRLCFGSKKLFREQFYLEENGYTSFEEWLQEWHKARSDSFYLVGSKDEVSGNQSCTAIIAEDESLTLRLRLPDALIASHGKYVLIHNVRFAYGHDVILASIRNCQARSCFPKEKNHYGVAISYRFKRDKIGWRLFVTAPYAKPAQVTRKELGVIGIDINADHLAVVETDRYGNPINKRVISLCTYGKTEAQTKALIGDAVKEIVNWAVASQKPIVLEKLDFQKKKTELREVSTGKMARMLSSFTYSTIIEAIKSRSFRFGVQVEEVNPAYTSVIGRVKFASRYGFSIHESAALVIGRRAQGFSEKMPRHAREVPDGKGGHVALSLPARNRDKHVWVLWRQVRRKLQTVLAAHFRTIKRSSSRQKPTCCDGSPPDFVGETQHVNSSVELLD
jgi:IS605 OrfB family transposase